MLASWSLTLTSPYTLRKSSLSPRTFSSFMQHTPSAAFSILALTTNSSSKVVNLALTYATIVPQVVPCTSSRSPPCFHTSARRGTP